MLTCSTIQEFEGRWQGAQQVAENAFETLRRYSGPIHLTRGTQSVDTGFRPALRQAKTSPKCYGDVLTARSRHSPDDEALLPLIKGRVEEGRATGIVLGVLDANRTRRILAYVDAVCGQGGS